MPHPDHEKNRACWNEIVDLHMNHSNYRTKQIICGGTSLKEIELEAIGDVTGKSLLHLMCQFGLDTLSWSRLGADVTGVDISDKSIQRAEEIRDKAGLNADFIRSDVLDLIGLIDNKFDIVFQSYGTHIWLSDIAAWAKVVAHYLKPGGIFFIIDEHPVNALFLYDPPLNYFSKEPERTIDATDYCDRNYIVRNEQVEWQHTVSDILNALIDAGLTIERMEEYNYGYYRVEEDWYNDEGDYWYPPGGPTKYPLMLSVKAKK